MNIVFAGSRTDAGDPVVTVSHGKLVVEHLTERRDLLDMPSIIGMEWGYVGEGPRLLAISILAEVTDIETARDLYCAFVLYFVCKMQVEGWTLTKAEIDKWLFQEIAATAKAIDEPAFPIVPRGYHKAARVDLVRRAFRLVWHFTLVCAGVAFVIGVFYFLPLFGANHR